MKSYNKKLAIDISN